MGADAGRPGAGRAAKRGDRRNPQPAWKFSRRTTFSAPAREGAEDEMKLRGLLRFFILLLVFLSCKTSSLAQNNSGDAAISGTIVDATGGAIGGVVVTANPEGQTGQVAASASSKVDGSYTLAVPAGRYRVRYARVPFSPLEEVVGLGAGWSG